MIETILVTARANPKIDPDLAIWDWRIAVYLFFGGLAAGILCFSAWTLLRRQEHRFPFTAWRLPLWAPIVLSLGMITLFFDLERKAQVFRFYTSFQPTSPMSYGSWILILVYPAALALVLATLGPGYPRLAGFIGRVPIGRRLLEGSLRLRWWIAWWNLPLGIALGIYTGILLSGFVARPFWNTALLGPLFLVSGLSTAAAVVLLHTSRDGERLRFTRIDMGLIILELGLIVLFLIHLGTGTRLSLQALESLLGGRWTLVFWIGFVGLGLLGPLVLESWILVQNALGSRGSRTLHRLAPVLVLMGGLILRQAVLDIGQDVRWTRYDRAFDPALLERLRP